MALADLDVVETERPGPCIDAERFVVLGPQVTERDVESIGIAPGGAVQNRLLRPSACAAHAAQLEDANQNREL